MSEEENPHKKFLSKIPLFKGYHEVMQLSGVVNQIFELGRNNYQDKISRQDKYDLELVNYLSTLPSTQDRLICLMEHEVECEKLIAKAISERMRGDEKYFNEILKEKILPKITVYSKQLRLDELKTVPTSEKSIGPNSDQSAFSWTIDPPERTRIVDYLIAQNCFFEKDRVQLLLTFNHEKRTGSSKIVARGLMKRLPTVMYLLHSAKKIKGKKHDIATWIMENFSTQPLLGGDAVKYEYSTVHGALNNGKPDKRVPVGHEEYIYFNS